MTRSYNLLIIFITLLQNSNGSKIKNINWPENIKSAQPGNFPKSSSFKSKDISWYNDLPNDYGEFPPKRNHRSQVIRGSQMQPLYTKFKETGYFSENDVSKNKAVKFPSIYPGFELSKSLGKRIGKQAFFEMSRLFGNQKDFLKNPEYHYFGAANEKCDVFYKSNCAERKYGDRCIYQQVFRCDDWSWDCSTNDWNSPLPYSELEHFIDCGFGNWSVFETKYNMTSYMTGVTKSYYGNCNFHKGLNTNDRRCDIEHCGEKGTRRLMPKIQFIPTIQEADKLFCRGWGEEPTAASVLLMVAKVLGIMFIVIAIIAIALLYPIF